MRWIDALHLDDPFAGSRMLQDLLKAEGYAVGRLRVSTLMKKMDIAYLPMARGLIYLATVLDWFSRKVLAWQVSIALEAEFCIEALEAALARYGRPEILNTDQGSQFTSLDFVQVPKDAEIAISMDGEGAWRDKVFVERLWRRVTYEEIDRHADAKVPEARASIGRYLAFYNSTRPHASPGGQPPDQAYISALQPIPAAA